MKGLSGMEEEHY